MIIMYGIFTALLYSLAIVAAPPIPAYQTVDMFHQIVQVEEHDTRQTFEEYAKERRVPVSQIRAKFSGSGIVVCNDNTPISAQVTGSRNVISTAGHLFRDPDSCRDKDFSKGCYFHTESTPNVKYEIDLKSLRMEQSCVPGQRSDDWAVLKLKRPVPNKVKPYKIPAEDVELGPNTEVVHVAAYSSDFERNGQRLSHVQHCLIRGADYMFNAPVRTNCTTGKGSSGSGQFIEDNNELVMVAINVHEKIGNRTKPKMGFNDGSQDVRKALYNGSVPLSGNFLTTIHEMVK